MLDEDGEWWARREVKPGKTDPPRFMLVNVDENTGKRMGWEPIEQSGFAKFHAEALGNPYERRSVGTYELCGPKVQGNPEGYEGHVLIPHADAEPFPILPTLLHFDGLRLHLRALGEAGFEGVVWHHPDGRMVKLKVRDFPSR